MVMRFWQKDKQALQQKSFLIHLATP